MYARGERIDRVRNGDVFMMARWKIWTSVGACLLLSSFLVSAPSFAVGNGSTSRTGNLFQSVANHPHSGNIKDGVLAPSILLSINPDLQSFPTTTFASGQLLNIPLTSLEWIMNDAIPGEYVNALYRVDGSKITSANTLVTFTYSDGTTDTVVPSSIIDTNGNYSINITVPTVTSAQSNVSIAVDAVSQNLHTYLWNVPNSGVPIVGAPTSMPGSPFGGGFLAAPVPVFTIEPSQIAGQLPEIPYAAALPMVMLGAVGMYWWRKRWYIARKMQ